MTYDEEQEFRAVAESRKESMMTCLGILLLTLGSVLAGIGIVMVATVYSGWLG